MLPRHRTRPEDEPADSPAAGLGAGRRTLALLTLVAMIGAPAGILRAFCAGHSCDEPANASSEVPFCSLPDGIRTRVAAGFREGRSPDLLAVAAGDLAAASEWPPVPWPSTTGAGTTRVPLAFWGTGVSPGAPIPEGTTLDAVAPTIEEILGFDRPHPEVRSGEAIPGVAAGEPPRLVVEIVWVGRGSDDLAGVPALERAMSAGAATTAADTGSLPVDPAAVLTTIGTGGRPSQHGITGTSLRDDSGKLRRAWTDAAPVSVIATLGDDLDEKLHEEPVVGIVAARRAYRGAVGGDWYIDVDEDVFVKTSKGREAKDAVELLRAGFGRDDVPDLAAVMVEGGRATLDRTVTAVAEEAERVSRGSVAFVFTATGATRPADVFEPPSDVAPLVEEVAPGGLFLDQDELAARRVSEDEVLRSLTAATTPGGDPVFADVFPAIAVAFGRYC